MKDIRATRICLYGSYSTSRSTWTPSLYLRDAAASKEDCFFKYVRFVSVFNCHLSLQGTVFSSITLFILIELEVISPRSYFFSRP